ncbi:MAG: UDP-3-O-(3-hydroxymyristoyl)glucosamine N-acyltransferase [Fibrobacteraceae bacterium]|nr:UDP-3-O-(3-hydroxymyristoyl)glucosamine N-acyltransferase [Fibrobacteraceae bacterium]
MVPVFLKEILQFLNIETAPYEELHSLSFSGVSSIEHAEDNQVSFWNEYQLPLHLLKNLETGKNRVGLLFVKDTFGEPGKFLLPNVKVVVPVENPYHAMVQFIHQFVEKNTHWEKPEVGEGTVVGPGCVLMDGVKIGKNCILEANVTLYPNVVIGDNCIFQAGAVVGSRGFGFYMHQGQRCMVPHIAGVRIGSHCSFGANMVVAAGFIYPTTIGNNCHFDSMVQIGHNCILGNNIFMASQCALGGTTTVKDNAVFAGAAKTAGHLTVGKNAVVAAKAGVTKSIPDGKTYAGFPAVDIELWRKITVQQRILARKKEKLHDEI